MKITIQGINYTSALDAEQPLTIGRKLNEPSECRLWLSLPADGSLAAPARNQSIAVTGDDGTLYFTGYIAVTPLPEYVGAGVTGPRYRFALQTVSDELLLNQSSTQPGSTVAGTTAGAAAVALVTRTGLATLSTTGISLATGVGTFRAEPGSVWSRTVGALADQARATYRALNGALNLASIPDTIHALNEADGTLNPAGLTLTSNTERALANDITVFGEHEPTAYVNEFFLGDGATTEFYLARAPYFPPSSQASLIREEFEGNGFNTSLWDAPDGYISIGTGGLVMSGGSGYDGGAILSTLSKVEMAGTLLLEAVGVSLTNGSAGVLPGFFVGARTQANCTAGFLATAASGTGVVTLQPLIEGVPSGATYIVNPANQYTLRIRVHCADEERDQPFYRTWGDSGQIVEGGGITTASAALLFEVEEIVDGVAGVPFVLYDGTVGELPDACWVVAVSALHMVGSVRELNLLSLGSGWVQTTAPGGGPVTRRLGSTAQGSECQIERSGRLAFFNGYQPPAGELIQVTYRATGRAAGRAVNTVSQAELAAAGLPSVAAWAGTVTIPSARSSQDCRNAARALVQAAASVSAAWSGSYKGTRGDFGADVWPGDALQMNIPALSLSTQMVVRDVKLLYAASMPDIVAYTIRFANDWADDLAIKTSTAVPADALLPVVVSPAYTANLNALSVTSISGSTVTINTGVAAPSGGGFEVRRRDGGFQPGEDVNLLARASTPTITLIRETASERFYVRMYDGATPPNYSEFSAELILNVPLGM